MLSAISCMVKIQSLEDLNTEIDYLNNRLKEIGNSWGFFNSFEKSHLTEKLRKLEKKGYSIKLMTISPFHPMNTKK